MFGFEFSLLSTLLLVVIGAVLTVTAIKGPHPGTVAANALDITWTAFPDTNPNTIPLTGREVLLLRNDDVGAQTITITSVGDPYKRLGTITDYSIGAGEYAAFSFVGPTTGWANANGQVTVQVSATNIMYAILRL